MRLVRSDIPVVFIIRKKVVRRSIGNQLGLRKFG